MSNRVLWLLVFLFNSSKLFSNIAYPYPVLVKTNSGYTHIIMCGDENRKFAKTMDGYSVVQCDNVWKFLYKNKEGDICISDYQLEDIGSRSYDLSHFLLTQEKGLSPKTTKILKSYPNNAKNSLSKTGRFPVAGKRKILVVLMEFTDTKFVKTQKDFDKLFNQVGYSEDGAIGSVYDYYKYVSYGQLDLECNIIGPYVAKHEMAYYGKNTGISGNDNNPFALFEEAVQIAANEVNLEEYDINEDGYIDNLHIIYAGYGEEAGAESDAIWAHEMTFDPKEIQGMKIDRYSCAPELRSNRGEGISRIGPHCHEIGHALGAMDYYDTDYDTDGEFAGTGKWDVMASGSWNNEGISPANFNPYVKAYDFGWMEVKVMNESADITLSPSSWSNTIYRVNTPVNGDYFLLENRQKESFDNSVPGCGLLMFHIGPKVTEASKTNTINSKYPQQCYVVCASSDYAKTTSKPSTYGDVNSAGCPFPGTSGNSSFSPTTTPAALCMNGITANFSITDISEAGIPSIFFSYHVGSDSIPIEENINTSGEVVWMEDFTNGLSDKHWEQEHYSGNSNWTVELSFSGGNMTHYATLKSNGTMWDADTLFARTALTTSNIDIPEGDYVLSVDYKNSNKLGFIDSLKVHIRTQGSDSWTLLSKIPVAVDFWNTYTVRIPKFTYPIELSLEGIVSKMSRIYVTNVIIRKSVDTKLISIKDNIYPKEPAVFYLNGNKGREIIKGINIIRKSDGTVTKIISK